MFHKSFPNKEECFKILEFLDAILVPPEHFRQEVLLSLQRIFEYHRATFFLIDNQGNMFDPVTLNIDDYYCDIYCDHYFKTDIFDPRRVKNKALEKNVITVTDLMPVTKFEMTEYYNDFLQRQNIFHEIAVFLLEGAKLIGVIGLFRSAKEKGFSQPEIKRLKKISTHVSRVLANNLLLEDTRYQKDIFEAYSNHSPIGLIIFDKNLNIHFFNDVARDICTEFLPGERTSSPEKFIKNFLGENSDWKPGFRKTILSPSLTRFTMHVLPAVHHNFSFKELYMACLFPEYFYSFKKLSQDKKLISENSLTNRERDILELMLKGMSNQKIADTLYISVHTVKTHMQNIFKKMDVTNRTSLIYKINLLNQKNIV
jgi:DNA-binding CsgD family transcriptional regulator